MRPQAYDPACHDRWKPLSISRCWHPRVMTRVIDRGVAGGSNRWQAPSIAAARTCDSTTTSVNINDEVDDTDDFFETIDDRRHRSQLTRPYCHVRAFLNRWSPSSIAGGGWTRTMTHLIERRTVRCTVRWPAPSIAAVRTVRLTATAINISDDVDKRDRECDAVDDQGHGLPLAGAVPRSGCSEMCRAA